MIERAIFVLTSPETGAQFLRVLPDLKAIGLSEATILHLLAARAGPAEPMPELANWVRHFEAAIPKVELALKRGDPVKWIHELARVRKVDIVVISGASAMDASGEDWDFECISSFLRRLGVPILHLPALLSQDELLDLVLVAVKEPGGYASVERELRRCLGAVELAPIHVGGPEKPESRGGQADAYIESVPQRDSVEATLLQVADERGATLLTLLDFETEPKPDGTLIVKPLIESAEQPVLIWPAPKPSAR